MRYRFKLNERMSAGASRIGLEQIEIAQTMLSSSEGNATAIHDARRSLKRLRALLRLIRPAVAESAYRREANRIAGVGRLLASARDRHVMQQTIVQIKSRCETLPEEVVSKLSKLSANASATKAVRAVAQERRQALGELEKARKFFAGIARRQLGIEQLAAGVKRSYRRARRSFKEAYESPSDDAFHEWRKAVQQHWRHMQLFSRCWPDVLGGRASEAKELSRLLGEDHDLHVLLAFAASRGKSLLSSDELAALTDTGRAVQNELRAMARPRGARLFAETADNIADHLVLYWSAAHSLSLLSPPKENGAKKPKAPRRDATRRRVFQAASSGERMPSSRRSGR